MSSHQKLIGLFGGTFDPIHQGHINLVLSLFEELPFDTIHVIPCGEPQHRAKPIATKLQRLEMTTLAIRPYPQLHVNDIEIHENGPTYSIDTIKTLRQQFRDKPLCFIMSTDAFAHFNEWHQWERILDYCHLIIVNRPKVTLPTADWLTLLLKAHQVTDVEILCQTLQGKIFFKEVRDVPISATELREELASGTYRILEKMLPTEVLQYIKIHHLYQK